MLSHENVENNLGLRPGEKLETCGKIEDIYDVKTGEIVSHEGKNYFFRSNGSVALLYWSLQDYKQRKNKKCIARSNLKGENRFKVYFDPESQEPTPEVLITDELKPSGETIEDILKTRPILATEEELKNMFERMKLKDKNCGDMCQVIRQAL